MRGLRLIVVPALLGLGSLLAGCQPGAQPPPQASPPGNLAEARALWKRHDIDSYRLVRVHHCFCLPEQVQPLEVEVREGSVSRVEGLEMPVRDWESGGFDPLTVQDLFSIVERARARQPHRLEVNYDPDYGFPRRIEVDRHAQMADDEHRYEVRAFEPL